MADTTNSTPPASPSSPAAPAAPVASPAADVLNLRAPALSATSDIPVLSPAPAARTESPAPAPAVDEAAAAAEAAGADGETGDGAGKGKDNTPAWQKAEITKERNRRRVAEEAVAKEREAREAAERRLDEALKAVPKAATEPSAPPPPAEPPRPKRPLREAFEDPDAFDRALSAHEDALIEWSSKRVAGDVSKQVEETRKAEEKKAEEKRTADEQRASADVAAKAWTERRTKAIAELPDFEAVAENPDVKISVPMAQEITRRADGPQLAYYLGQNPDEAERISALAPIDAIVELRLISKQLATPKAPELTKAPDPVRTVGARAAATRKGPDEESMEEYAARRQKEVRSAAH